MRPTKICRMHKTAKLAGFELGFSRTRWLDYFFHFWLFTPMKICPIAVHIFDKISSKFCQILNEHFQNGQSVLTLCQIGEISPNLVTLFGLSELKASMPAPMLLKGLFTLRGKCGVFALVLSIWYLMKKFRFIKPASLMQKRRVFVVM